MSVSCSLDAVGSKTLPDGGIKRKKMECTWQIVLEATQVQTHRRHGRTNTRSQVTPSLTKLLHTIEAKPAVTSYLSVGKRQRRGHGRKVLSQSTEMDSNVSLRKARYHKQTCDSPKHTHNWGVCVSAAGLSLLCQIKWSRYQVGRGSERCVFCVALFEGFTCRNWRVERKERTTLGNNWFQLGWNRQRCLWEHDSELSSKNWREGGAERKVDMTWGLFWTECKCNKITFKEKKDTSQQIPHIWALLELVWCSRTMKLRDSALIGDKIIVLLNWALRHRSREESNWSRHDWDYGDFYKDKIVRRGFSPPLADFLFFPPLPFFFLCHRTLKNETPAHDRVTPEHTRSEVIRTTCSAGKQLTQGFCQPPL